MTGNPSRTYLIEPGLDLESLLSQGLFLRQGTGNASRAVYYDTADLRLTRSGASLLWRPDSNAGGWEASLPSSPFRQDQELQLPGSPSTVPPEAKLLLRSITRSGRIGRVGRLEVLSQRIDVLDQRTRVVARFERQRFHAVGPVLLGKVFDRLTLAPKSPSRRGREAVRQISRSLRAAGALKADLEISPLQMLLGPEARRPADGSPPGSVTTLAELFAAAVSSDLARLIAYDPTVRHGDDPEDLHQARVAVRRMRADLWVFRKVIDPAWAARMKAELRWLGSRLGRVRDADVMAGIIEEEAQVLSPGEAILAKEFLQSLSDQRAVNRASLLASMDSPRYDALLDAMVSALDQCPILSDFADQSSLSWAARLVSPAWKRLARGVEGLDGSPHNEELHAVRISAKQCRYAVEVASVANPDVPRLWAKQIAAMQDVLGRGQDATVAESWLREEMGKGASLDKALVAGQIVAGLRQRQRVAASTWEKSWVELSKPHWRRWMS